MSSLDASHILTCGKRVLSVEAEGLTALHDILGDSFVQAVERLYHCPGQVIVTGMGKSGHIARKIAATLASTGTKSMFLHPAEASHGDLGMVGTDDLVVALSASGETRELSDIIAYCHRHNIPLIGMTLHQESTLGTQSDICLALPVVAEACPNRLAPTTSSTMMLALGDALAMTLLEQRGFSPKDFKEYHPGGKLGQQLSRVRDLMSTPENTPIIEEAAPMREAIFAITKYRLGCVGVVDQKGVLTGMVTDGDIRRHLEDPEPLLNQQAVKAMTADPVTIHPDELAATAVRLMQEKKITNVFAVKEGKPVGVLHIHDCLKAGIF